MSEVRRLAEECAALLGEACALLERVPPPIYESCFEKNSGSVGNQLRHCLDCFACFFNGLETGRVDYDRRERDARTEVDLRHASQQLRATAQVLRREIASQVDCALVVCMDEPERARSEGWHRSSAARELRFLASHTLHHFA